MLNIMFVEAALETIPSSIHHHPSVRRNAKRRRKQPSEILLDRSLHHRAMKSLPKSHKRGRPDIIHFCLLEALGSPLNRENGLRIWVHTIGDCTLEISPKVKLPRNCTRFNGLMEQLFTRARVPPEGKKPLLSLNHMSFSSLMDKINPSLTLALTSHGRPCTLEKLCRRLDKVENNTVLIGAYPSGPMEAETLSHADDSLSIYPDVLDAWVVTSRLIYEFERYQINKPKD